MIPLTEWSRRRPPPVFAGFDGAPVFDEGSVEFEGLLGDLIQNLQIGASAGAQAAIDASCAEAKQEAAAATDAKIQAMALRIGAQLTQHFNAVLKPWMGRQIEETAIEAFCAAVAQAVGDELTQEIAVEAPQLLRDKLAARFGADSIRANVTDSRDSELHAKVGSTSISTEISVWQARLNSVLP